MSGDRPHMPESDFKSSYLSMTPPGLEDEEMDFPDQLNRNASITNEGAGKLTGLLNYLAEFNDTISINDGRGRRVRVLGIEDVAGADVEVSTGWWALSISGGDEEVKVTIGRGMCERPVKFKYEKTDPMPHAWGHLTEKDFEDKEEAVEGSSHKIGAGRHKFYVKATCEKVERTLSNIAKSHSFNFEGFTVMSSDEDEQPEDTAYEKYKYLGVVVVEENDNGGLEVDLEATYWRTGHIFNWTYYTFVSVDDVRKGEKHLNLKVTTKYYSILDYDNPSTGGMGKGGGANIMTFDGEGDGKVGGPDEDGVWEGGKTTDGSDGVVTHYWRFGLYMGDKEPKGKDGKPLKDEFGKEIVPIEEEVDNWVRSPTKAEDGEYTTEPNIETITLAVCKSGVPKEVKFVTMK